MTRINGIYFFLALLLFFLYVSCSSRNRSNTFIRHQVKRTEFVNKITTSGIIEATKTYSVTCPGIWTDATITYLIHEGTYVDEGDTVCILQASELKNSYDEAVKNLENAKAEYNKSVADLNLQYLLLESQVKTIESSAEISRLDSSKIAFTSRAQRELIELKIEKAEVEKEKIQKKLEFLKVINTSELKKMEMKIKQAENNVARQKEQLDKLVLTSTTAGMVTYAMSWTTGNKIREGDIVWGNLPIISIPDMSSMTIKLTVNETHFKQIEKDQIVNIRIDAFPEIMLTGKITKKTPMGKPIKKDSKVNFFEVFASIDSTHFKIQPGLSVTCDVIIESIPDTLVVPLLAVFGRDSLKVVYISEGEKFLRQTVKVACNSDNYAVIAEGLKGNEEIILAEPPENLLLMKDK
ncbi:efflux RND transporter periplasmic adaptor subunit [bacterium]|nr:efflux RND transporter periplasmic adaptor subunit [bacterium]